MVNINTKDNEEIISYKFFSDSSETLAAKKIQKVVRGKLMVGGGHDAYEIVDKESIIFNGEKEYFLGLVRATFDLDSIGNKNEKIIKLEMKLEPIKNDNDLYEIEDKIPDWDENYRKYIDDDEVATAVAGDVGDVGDSSYSSYSRRPQQQTLWELNGLRLEDVPPDGNCFFYALGTELNRIGVNNPDGVMWEEEGGPQAANKMRQIALDSPLWDNTESLAALEASMAELKKKYGIENFKESIGPLKQHEKMNPKRWGNHLTLSLLMHYFKEHQHPHFKGIVIWQHSILGTNKENSRPIMIEYINVDDESKGGSITKTLAELLPNWDHWVHLAFTNDNHYQVVKRISGESKE